MSYNPNNPNGQATMANSAPVVLASNQSSIPVTLADGADGATGSKADAVATTDNGAFSQIALIKRMLTNMIKALDVDNAPLTNTKPGIVGGKAIDVTAPTAFTAGDAVTDVHDSATGAKVVLQGDLNPRYDGVSISGSIKKLTFEITRPANTDIYAIGDMIGSGTYNINNITSSLTTAESSGYLVGAKLLSTDTGIVSKRLSLNIFDAGSGSYISTDNQGFGGGYAVNKDRIIRVDFDNITNVLGASAGVECMVNNIGYPYKLTSGTKFNLILLTKDVFTPSANSTTFYLELYIDYNP